MKFVPFAALIALAALTVALAMPAEAAKRKRVYADPQRQVISSSRPSTRLTVRRRSYLSGGTETKGYDQHYTDYAFPPGYSAYPDRNDWKGSFNRMPLPDPWDIPGWQKF